MTQEVNQPVAFFNDPKTGEKIGVLRKVSKGETTSEAVARVRKMHGLDSSGKHKRHKGS
jgi:hypothetical protein